MGTFAHIGATGEGVHFPRDELYPTASRRSAAWWSARPAPRAAAWAVWPALRAAAWWSARPVPRAAGRAARWRPATCSVPAAALWRSVRSCRRPTSGPGCRVRPDGPERWPVPRAIRGGGAGAGRRPAGRPGGDVGISDPAAAGSPPAAALGGGDDPADRRKPGDGADVRLLRLQRRTELHHRDDGVGAHSTADRDPHRALDRPVGARATHFVARQFPLGRWCGCLVVDVHE